MDDLLVERGARGLHFIRTRRDNFCDLLPSRQQVYRDVARVLLAYFEKRFGPYEKARPIQ